MGNLRRIKRQIKNNIVEIQHWCPTHERTEVHRVIAQPGMFPYVAPTSAVKTPAGVPQNSSQIIVDMSR